MHCNLRPRDVAQVVFGLNYEPVAHQSTKFQRTGAMSCRVINDSTRFAGRARFSSGEIVLLHFLRDCETESTPDFVRI